MPGADLPASGAADPEESYAAGAWAAADEAEQARDDARSAERRAGTAQQQAREAEQAARAAEREAEQPEFGRLGRPLRRDSPFMIGFLGALGVFVAWFLTQAVVQARSVIVLIVVALFLAIGLNPVVERLVQRGLRRGAAVLIVFVVVIGAFVGFGYAVLPPVIHQSNGFVQELPSYLSDLRRNPTVRQLDDDYGVIGRAQEYVKSPDLGARTFGGVVGVGKLVISAIFSALSVLILTLYFLAALPSIKRQTYRLVPATRRERVTLLGDEVLNRIGGFVSGALTVAFIAGLTSYFFLLAVDMPFALALAVFVAIFDLIPLIGATIAAVVVTLVGLTQSLVIGLLCIGFYVAYQQFENYVVYPRVMRRAVDVPAPVTIVAVLIGGALLGVIGALLAIPVAAAVLLVVRQVTIPRMDQT